MNSPKFSLCTLLTFLSLLTVDVVGQTSRGTLTGTVTDNTGAVVAKATVKITQLGTGAIRQTTTNSAGIYRFDAVELERTPFRCKPLALRPRIKPALRWLRPTPPTSTSN